MDKPKVLTAKELRTILPRLSGWKLAHDKLTRTFEFQDFVASLSFVNSLKVTDRDVEVAKKISSVYRSRT